VFTEALASLPEWLVTGLLLGAVGVACIAGVFVVGGRLFPAAGREQGRRQGGGRKRRAEIRAYLRAIDEPFAEDRSVEGQSVAFYLSERDVAITFDARAYYRIGRSPTRAVLVEHEMPGVHLGSRLPFETPAIDAGAGRDGRGVDATSAAFAVLGLPTSATPSEIRGAYREKVKEVHPDHGGDPESFRRVREAYTAAKEHAT
jgi:hypothetical protein